MKYDSNFTSKPDIFGYIVRYFHFIFDFSTLLPLHAFRQFSDRTRHLQAHQSIFFWFRHYGFRFFGGQFQSNHALKWYFRVLFFFWFWIAITTKVHSSINTYIPSYYLQYFIKIALMRQTGRPYHCEQIPKIKFAWRKWNRIIYLEEPFQSTVKL